MIDLDTLERRPTHQPRSTALPSYLPPAAAAVLALEHRTCRWPIGLPAFDGFHFCGSPVTGRGSYCRHHATLSRAEPLR